MTGSLAIHPSARPTGAGVALPLSPVDVQSEIEVLADRARTGCARSFEALVAHFEKRIFHYLRQLTRNEHDAEDLTQVTFLKAYQNIHRYQSNRAFHAWLFTIAKRTALNHFRDSHPADELQPDLPSPLESPSQVVEKEDARAGLWNLARTLKADQYESLWLRYGEGFSISEIARIRGTTSLGARVLLHRARAALAKKLSYHKEKSLDFVG